MGRNTTGRREVSGSINCDGMARVNASDRRTTPQQHAIYHAEDCRSRPMSMASVTTATLVKPGLLRHCLSA